MTPPTFYREGQPDPDGNTPLIPLKRYTAHLRTVNRLRSKIEDELSAVVLRQLRWLWRRIYPEVRAMRVKRDNIQKLNIEKQGITLALWDEFQQRLKEAMEGAVLAGAAVLVGNEKNYWDGQDYSFSLDTDAIAGTFAGTIGERITAITDLTRQDIGQAITEWYQTPGATVQDLVGQLQSYVGPSRAASIAQTEITSLNSHVVQATGAALGFDRFTWQSMRDEITCTKPFEFNGNIWNGCRALHGQEFSISEKMPPAHPRCRCFPSLKVKQ